METCIDEEDYSYHSSWEDSSEYFNDISEDNRSGNNFTFIVHVSLYECKLDKHFQLCNNYLPIGELKRKKGSKVELHTICLQHYESVRTSQAYINNNNVLVEKLEIPAATYNLMHWYFAKSLKWNCILVSHHSITLGITLYCHLSYYKKSITIRDIKNSRYM